MITSIFSKSKPINFIIVFFITLLAFTVTYFKLINEPITIDFVLKQVVLFSICYISILVLNFIVSKNKLTKNNNYEILLYSLFLLAIVQTTTNINMLFANFFVLLGLRRVLSIRSQKNVKKKLFDAAFWIAIASLFYFWAILFFIVIIVSLILYTDNKLNHWIIPFSGVLTVFLITVCVSIIRYDDFFSAFNTLPKVSYDFSSYNSTAFIIAITMLFSFGIWSTIFFIKTIKQKKKAFRPSFNVVLIAMLVAFIVVIFAPEKDGSEFLFMFAPLAIIITNYIEVIQEKWFKEVFLLLLILVPFVILVL
ncbi:DUF6427 family protein [uncultured Algibacter sp.]|uniref:DUF6427 family protein n=1 Tax=uncultured Algibacter sp. TaxID=298659 RepID=UPI00260B614B|nr:DUF6427 family protein [uncultured Algibacter sp.]